MTTPWLSLIGIGEDGRDGLSPAAQSRLAQARLVVGGRRHLALAAPLGEAATMAWPSPLADALPAILARRGEPVCVLASGDPFFHGVGTLIARRRAAGRDRLLARALLAQPGRGAARLEPAGLPLAVAARPRPAARHPPPAAQGAPAAADMGRDHAGRARRHALGTRLRRVAPPCAAGARRSARNGSRRPTRARFDLDRLDPLNVVGLEVEAGVDARVIPLACGLPNDWFEHDGQITKAEVRAATLAALRPFRGAHLWDIGAGSGSVSIEWMLRDPAMRANRHRGARRGGRNASRATRGAFGVPGLAIVIDQAPAGLSELAPPDAVFIGGGAGHGALIEAAWFALPVGGRLVVNAVTIETAASLATLHASRGGELTTLSVARSERIGRYSGWRPAMPVTQWAVTRR